MEHPISIERFRLNAFYIYWMTSTVVRCCRCWFLHNFWLLGVLHENVPLCRVRKFFCSILNHPLCMCTWGKQPCIPDSTIAECRCVSPTIIMRKCPFTFLLRKKKPQRNDNAMAHSSMLHIISIHVWETLFQNYNSLVVYKSGVHSGCWLGPTLFVLYTLKAFWAFDVYKSNNVGPRLQPECTPL